MTLPVIERIAVEIRRRLNPSSDRNKALGIATIARPSRVIPDFSSVVVQQGPSKPLPKLDYPGNPPAKCFEVVFSLNCLIDMKPSEAEFATACNTVVADIVDAITNPEVSSVTWHTFGGLALLAQIGSSRDLITALGVNGGVSIPLTVQYRVAQNDHSQVR